MTSATSVTKEAQIHGQQGFELGTLLRVFGTLVTLWRLYKTVWTKHGFLVFFEKASNRCFFGVQV